MENLRDNAVSVLHKGFYIIYLLADWRINTSTYRILVSHEFTS